MTDDTGAVVERYSYGDYGEPAFFDGAGNPIGASAIGNPYLFHGRRYDPETGLYYYRTRYLDPRVGRFLSRDTIGLYGDPANLGNGQAFVGNNPWSRVDPYGEGWFTYLLTGDYEASDREAFKAFIDFGREDAVLAGEGLSTVPVIGIPADIALTGEALERGAYGEATLNAIGIIPFAGDLFVLSVRSLKNADKLRNLDTLTDLSKSTQKTNVPTKKSPNQLGREGEEIVSELTGLTKNTEKFSVNGNKRIPDFVAERNDVTGIPTKIFESKNVAKQAFTKQLRDSVELVGPDGRVFVVVRKNTRITGPLMDAHLNPRSPIRILHEFDAQ